MAASKVVLDGERIRGLRERRGFSSQSDLALATVTVDPKRGGLGPRTVWDAENGKPVTRRTQLLIARALGVDDCDELLLRSGHQAVRDATRASLPLNAATSAIPFRYGQDRRWLGSAGRAAALCLVFIAGAALVTSWQFGRYETSSPDETGAPIGLDTAVWTVNGPAARAALTNMDAPRARIVQPMLSFSRQRGLGISGIDGTYEQEGIQTVKPFRPPFTVRATVMTTAVNAGAFALLVTSADGGRGVSLTGGKGANDVFTGLTYQSPSGPGTHWRLRGKLSEPRAPSLNVWYQLAIAVDASGNATLSAAPQGTEARSSTLRALGTGPFYVLLSQGSGAYGSGPNQAYWRSITITGRDTVVALRFRREAPRVAELARYLR
ncbi:MAG: helix-turn-helix transcriptional regulator [Candidatus Eremiobacteraeota bacterium]|nr:helix-turn-helix transcriptional regulator [Candidatus Eremiobacteraeota bacterium]